MKHFDEASWADFARELVPAGERVLMQAHLDGGCERCTTTLQLCNRVLSLAIEEKELAPPDDTVRVVKAQFATFATLGNYGVRLVFDSHLAPEGGGIRGSVFARQTLFETDELYVDLRLDPGAERVSLVGQIMDRAKASQAVEGLPIQLHQGLSELKATNTNQFGEFQFEFRPGTDFYISIARREKQSILLPLYGTNVGPENRDSQ